MNDSIDGLDIIIAACVIVGGFTGNWAPFFGFILIALLTEL